ncbi:MAG TPA: RsmE family RNA methyltransferase, partial [Patescibacteria group bacterium]|nr:RsmE family RNA methyltransferase [Patescibacteria group bacterium]
GQLVIANGEIVHQIKDVLKLKKDERIMLGDGNGRKAEAEIVGLGKYEVEVFVIKVLEGENEPNNQVSLYCAILKRENLELAVQKAVEAGVYKIVPILTERTIKVKINRPRLKKIIKEAVEQSERSVMPLLREPLDLEEAINDCASNNLNIFFDPGGKSVSALPRMKKPSNVGIFIGPEGGWSEKELALAKDKGLKIVSLGKTILRGETAAIIGAYLGAYLN